MSALAAGSTLCDGRYRLDEIIGRGGMAIVWRAKDLQLERDVAIKVISDALAEDPRFITRFQREARLAAGLSHPNLVKVFDFSVDSERPFLIMEYVPGGTLREARERPLDALALAHGLLDALAHIHAAGILHRDVKPANVLLGADGSPRLTDFGIARSDEQTTSLTMTGQVLGTLKYIAPEVAAGEPATARSDLFSLGVMLGEIAGEEPSGPLAELLPRLNARDPHNRPASAGAALAELDPTVVMSSMDAEAMDPEDDTAALERTEQTRALSTTGIDGLAPAPPSPARAALHHADPRIKPAHLAAAAVALIVILVVVVIAATSGGDKPAAKTSTAAVQKPAPAGATVDDQLSQLEKIVRAAPQKP